MRNYRIIREIKLNIYLVFITQSYFAVPKNIRLNSTNYFVMKIHLPPTKKNNKKKKNLKIPFNHSSDITDFQDFMNLYKKCTEKPYDFLFIDTTFASDNSSRFRKDLFEKI